MFLGPDNLVNGNWVPRIGGGGLQNPVEPNPWPPGSAQATAFASANAGSKFLKLYIF